MRVCIFTDAWLPIWGGGQVHIWETAKELITQHDCDVDIFVPNLTDKTRVAFPKDESHLEGKLRLHRLGPKFIFPNFIGRILFTLSCLVQAITKEFDVYHSHTLTMVPFLPVIKLFHPQAKTAFTLHGSGKGLLGVGFLNRVLPLKVVADLFLYKTPVNLRFTAAKSSIRDKSQSDFVFLGNAVSDSFFKESKKPKHTHKLLFVGRLEPVKGIFNLLSVIRDLAKEDELLKLVIVGHGPLEGQVTSFIHKHHLKEIVELKHLTKNEVIAEYEKADIFVLPSLSEGFPLTILEAMAMSLPIVATNVGDVSDIIEDGRTGFLAKPGDEQSLSETIKKAIRSDRQKIGHAAQKQVKTMYSWEKIASEIYAQYTKKIS